MNKKIKYISLLNILSCYAVVQLHTNSCFWIFSKDRYWLTANIIESVFYFAVPIFFMISGATLIDYRDKYDTKSYMKKRIKKAFIPFMIWSLIGLLYIILKDQNVILNKNILDIFSMIINTNIISIYWFFIPLFSIYLSIPLLSLIPKNNRKNIFTYLVIATFLTMSFIPTVCSLIGLTYNYDLNIPVASGYIIYILIGYLISHYEIPNNKRKLIYLFSAIGLAIHILGTYSLSMQNEQIMQTFKGYLNFPCVLYSTGIFTFFKYFKIPKKLSSVSKKFDFIDKYTFGIYLIHYFVIDILTHLLKINIFSIYYRIIAPIVVIAICIIILYFIKKIPILKNIVP